MPQPPFIQRLRHHLVDMLGLHLKFLAGPEQRMRQVRITAVIGGVVGLLFGAFNLLTPGMALLGAVEWAAVVLLLAPALALARAPQHLDLAESLVLLAALSIFGALIVLGGVGGTGLFWAYTAPFVAFFLKGQKQGWRYSLMFLAAVVCYFLAYDAAWTWAWAHAPESRLHFVLSLGFYTLVAANFNLLRARFEEQLVQKVEEKAADADKLRSEMQFLATHDTVTGLPNRTRLMEHLELEMQRARQTSACLVVCNLRLERLFELSNVLGQAGADRLVRQVAAHLQRITEGHGMLARMRRDEFAIVYRVENGPPDAHALGRFISQQDISVEEEGLSLYVELTLGLALYPEHGTDTQSLLRRAEQATLQARRHLQPWAIYDEQQEQLFRQHHLLFGKLRQALLEHRLVMHYQPQVDLRNGWITGAEALVRWPDPVLGMISPAQFIPVAEESGLIRPLTAWVLQASLRDCAVWRQAGLPLRLSVNLSAMNLLDPELPGTLAQALADSGLPADCVNLEITESCLMASPQRAMSVLQSIHEAGFRLSIDDFGTGYSSLSYLKSMPINELKIDQSFVRHLLSSPSDQAIVASTVALAHNFGLEVVAEGIEDEDTARWLKNQGCDTGQGYRYARPMPAAELQAFAASRSLAAQA